MRRKSRTVYSRRDFIGNASASAFAFTFLPSRVWGANERLNMASIGVGGKGGSDSSHAGELGDMVALCDIDDNTLRGRAKASPRAVLYNDFRVMLEEMDKSIDAVTVSTPDHTHAPAAIMAMRMGKHVYCQKPLTHTVYEARLMRETAQGYKVATQMGNQGTAENGLREAVEVIQSGAIGPVREVHVWTNRPVWPQAPGIVARPTERPAVPAHVHWDQFLGPAKDRPYHGAYHPFKWRGWWDFGTGALGDMACHTANMAFMALNLGYPDSVYAENGPLNPETYPEWATVKFQFPSRGYLPPVDFYWYEGKLPNGEKNLPPKELFHGNKPPGSGSLLVGDKGILYSANDYGSRYKLLPEEQFEGFEKPAQSLPRNGRGDKGMKEEWVEAIKGGKPAMSNFNYAGLLTETILLGNIAMRSDKKLLWDGPNLKFTNSSAANQFIHKAYRDGWEL
jgi:predicted dehydrogenase